MENYGSRDSDNCFFEYNYESMAERLVVTVT